MDGGPAAKPESTPLKKDIPRLLAPEEARKLITALRKAKDTEILGSNALVVQSGQEAFGSKVKEVMFPESYEDEEYFEPVIPGDEDVDDDDEEEVIIKRRRPLPKEDELTIWDLGPIMGEPRQDLGFTLTATPQVSASGKYINLDLHPKMVVAKKAKPMFFFFSTFETRTQIGLPDGYTMIAFCGLPAPQGDYPDYKQDASTDRRPYIMFVTAKIIEHPKGSAKK